MLGKRALHRADVIASLKAGALERAAGFFWAMASSEINGGSDDLVRGPLVSDMLQAREQADARGERDDAIRLLAAAYAISQDPVSLSRLLFDLLDRLTPEALRELASRLIAASAPTSQPYCMGFFQKTRAEHLMAGLTEQEARTRAATQTIAWLDMMLHRDPTLDLLRAERLAKNIELLRYAAAIEDIRSASPALAQNSYVRNSCFIHLRHVLHPETRRAIDQLMIAPTPDPDSMVSHYVALVAMKAIEESVQMADRLAPVYPQYGIVRPLKQMTDNLDLAPLTSFGRAPIGRHLIYLSFVSWGPRFIEMSANTGLPSLLAPGNLPQLAEDNDLVVEFVTNASDLAQILAIPAIQQLAEIAQIKIFGFPPEIEPLQNRLPYVTFGYASHGTIFRAQRDGADLIFLLSDVVWSNGSFEAVAALVTKEKRVVFTDGLNARASAVLPALDAYRSADRSNLSISANDLWTLAAPALMPRTRDHFYDPRSSKSRAMPVRVAFQEADSLTIHGFHKLPLYVSHAAFAQIRYFSYTTPDGAFSESVLDNVDPSQAICFEEFDTIMAVELSDEEGATSREVEADIVESITRYFRDSYFSERLYWNFQHGVRFPMKPAPGSPIMSEKEKNDCLSRIRAQFATHPVFVDWGRERDKIRRLEFGDGATRWRLTSTEEMKACCRMF